MEQTMLFNDCIILAGGAGSRLWPASNSKTPKQFLAIPPNRSFFAAAIERALLVTETACDSKVIIVAGANHVSAIEKICASFTKAEQSRVVVIPEPEGKNTAPAIAVGLFYINLSNDGKDRRVLVLTSDHLISPLETFKADAMAAAAFTRQENLVVFGIPPLSPNTGYGYIETARQIAGGASNPPNNNNYEPEVFEAAAFHEKPNAETAERFIKAGNFYWNSGMFAFSSSFLLNQLRNKTPDLYNAFCKLKTPAGVSSDSQNGLCIINNWQGIKEVYREIPKISFDYAIAEKSEQTVMVKAAFQWTDVGSWDVYAQIVSESAIKNQETEKPISAGTEVFSVSSETCFVDSDIPVALVNAEDLIIVIRIGKDGGPKAALIAKKGETQKVQEIVKQIKDAGRTGLL